MYHQTFLTKLPLILVSQSCLFQTVSSHTCNYTNLLHKQILKRHNIVPPNGQDLCNIIAVQSCRKSTKSRLDYSKVPNLEESDLIEQFVRGDGPGGQATAKTNNAVVLKHKPTNIVVKCHETRSLWENKKRARERLITKLDNMINGTDSIENQERLLLAKKSSNMLRKKEKMAALKAAFRKREGLD